MKLRDDVTQAILKCWAPLSDVKHGEVYKVVNVNSKESKSPWPLGTIEVGESGCLYPPMFFKKVESKILCKFCKGKLKKLGKTAKGNILYVCKECKTYQEKGK